MLRNLVDSPGSNLPMKLQRLDVCSSAPSGSSKMFTAYRLDVHALMFQNLGHLGHLGIDNKSNEISKCLDSCRKWPTLVVRNAFSQG